MPFVSAVARSLLVMPCCISHLCFELGQQQQTKQQSPSRNSRSVNQLLIDRLGCICSRLSYTSPVSSHFGIEALLLACWCNKPATHSSANMQLACCGTIVAGAATPHKPKCSSCNTPGSIRLACVSYHFSLLPLTKCFDADASMG